MFMAFRLPHILAILLACATGVAGVPLIAASAPSDPQAGPYVAPVPCDPEGISESRVEAGEEERGEEEDGDSEIEVFSQPLVAVVLDMRRTGRTAHDFLQAAAGSLNAARFIRGPPAG
jgi:hypothetical protein